jgi:hypothetical protein
MSTYWIMLIERQIPAVDLIELKDVSECCCMVIEIATNCWVNQFRQPQYLLGRLRKSLQTKVAGFFCSVRCMLRSSSFSGFGCR